MRLPFVHPRKDEVAAIATDLITRFGLHALDEALYLAELSLQMRSRRKRVLYECVAREIETSFLARSAEATRPTSKRVRFSTPCTTCSRGEQWRRMRGR